MLTVTFEDRTILHIEDSVLDTIANYMIPYENKTEAGGILLGKQTQNIEEYVLCEISVPNACDTRKSFSFIRSKQHAQGVIDQVWNESNGVINYMGEWHTHPKGSSMPSAVDRKLIKQVIRDRSNVYEKVFLIIAGGCGSLYIGVAGANGRGDIYMWEKVEGVKWYHMD